MTKPAEKVWKRPGPPPDRLTCWTRKERFESQRHSEEVLSWWRKTNPRKHPNHVKLRPYECPYCHGWHLTRLENYKPKKMKGAWA